MTYDLSLTKEYSASRDMPDRLEGDIDAVQVRASPDELLLLPSAAQTAPNARRAPWTRWSPMIQLLSGGASSMDTWLNTKRKQRKPRLWLATRIWVN